MPRRSSLYALYGILHEYSADISARIDNMTGLLGLNRLEDQHFQQSHDSASLFFHYPSHTLKFRPLGEIPVVGNP